MGGELARAAEALVGTPFRLHGRDPATGLDCIGVLAASLTACGMPAHLPSGYALRMRTQPELAAFVSGCGLVPAAGIAQSGDVLLLQAGPVQLHLAIASSQARFVHAHAGLRRVIHSDLPSHWPVIAHWRLVSAS